MRECLVNRTHRGKLCLVDASLKTRLRTKSRVQFDCNGLVIDVDCGDNTVASHYEQPPKECMREEMDGTILKLDDVRTTEDAISRTPPENHWHSISPANLFSSLFSVKC